MVTIIYNDKAYSVPEKQTVLSALEENGVKIPYSCRVGLCHACLMKADKSVPAEAQNGLSSLQQSQNYFLACQCFPEIAMTVSLPNTNDTVLAMLHSKRVVSHSRVEIQLMIDKPWFSGQTIKIFKEPGVGLEYCLAQVEGSNRAALVVDAANLEPVNQWLCTEVAMNTSLIITGPQGVCHYSQDTLDHELLLVSSSLTVPAMLGIVSDAIDKHHASKIKVYYQADTCNAIYLAQLKALAGEHKQLHLTEVNDKLIEAVTAEETELRNTKVFLLGGSAMVGSLQRHCFFKGATNSNIKTVSLGGVTV